MTHHAHNSQAEWVLSWITVTIVLVVLSLYLFFATRRRARIKSSWSTWRIATFTCGIALLVVAFAPHVADSAHENLKSHMVQHLLIGMFAPIGLVLGAPVTLLLRSVPVGTGRRIASLLRSRPVHVLGHPTAALVLNIGGMYALYVTPLFAATQTSPLLHALVNLHFLTAGYLFAWSIAGPDPAPGRPGLATRAMVLTISVAAHAYLGKMMYAHLWPRGTDFSADELREAAVLMYYGGDLAEALLAIALFASWYQRRRRARQRTIAVLTKRSGRHPMPALPTS